LLPASRQAGLSAGTLQKPDRIHAQVGGKIWEGKTQIIIDFLLQFITL